MKLFRALGLVTVFVTAAYWLDSRSQQRQERRRERERIEKTRWEGEGGATPTGPHINESPASDEPLRN